MNRQEAAGEASHAVLNPYEAAQRQRGVLLRIVRMAFFTLFVTVTLLAIFKQPDIGGKALLLKVNWHLTTALAVGLVLIVILVDVLTPTKKISTLFSIFFGLLGAMLATIAFGFIIDLLATMYEIRADDLIGTTKVLVGIALAYLAISVILQTQDDFRLVIPYVEFARQLRGPRPLLVDSSALIDGRIVDLARLGMIQSPIVIPRFVVGELQLMADQGDRGRRVRGRRGLDMIGRLQRSAGLDVIIEESKLAALAVDATLVELAREMQAAIITTDSGLKRVAEIQGVMVINVHDLAAALKPNLAAGDELEVELLRPGEQPGQAVGYLEDGTMVVVEEGAAQIGRIASLVVQSTLQTSAGRLVFARPLGSAPPAEPENAGAEPPAEASAPPEGEPEPTAERQPQRGPFPPKGPRSLRDGSPRNPRR